MSDDIRKRFEFPNSLIQSQAVGHLIAAVLKESGFSEKIHQSTDQTPALNLLWEKCCGDNAVVRTACCEALVALVAQDHAEFSYVLNGILNLIPSTRNTHGLLKAIMKLLQMQALKEGQGGEKNIRNLYTIRNRPQPLITVLEHRPDCWPVLLQQLTAFFQRCPERSEVSCIQIMAPFLWYLYCEPSQLEEYAKLRLTLLKVLLQPRVPGDTEQPSTLEQQILQLCCDMVPCLQVKDLVQTTEVMTFIEEVYLSLLRHPTFWKIQLSQLTLQLLCVCEVSLKITGEFSSLIHLLEHSVELLKEDFPVELVIIGIALLLLQTPASQQKPILSLALKLVSFAEGQKIPKASLVLVMPLLQILSSTALEDCMSTDEEGPSRQQLALNLLEIVQQESCRDDHQKLSYKLAFPITGMYGSIFTAWRILEVMREKSAASDWLFSVESLLPITTVIPAHVFLLLAHLLVEDQGQNLRQILKVTTELAQADSSQVPNLIPVLMFKLGRPLEPVLYNDILYTLPTLGVHKVCIGQILRVIQLLGTTPHLRAVTVRLLTSLWEKQDRVYPELQRFMAMSDVPSLSVGKEVQWEKLIAKAASIRDICKQRPYQHGADMLAAISQVLNECTKPDQATPAALVLQGLHALCQAEVVCIRSTWNALSPKLSCDTRPLILKTLSELFSLVPSLTVNTAEYENFKVQVLSFLWTHTQNKESIVANAAYKSLSHFSAGEHTVLHLPEEIRPEIPIPDELEEDEDDEGDEKDLDLSIPGSCYLKLLSLTAPLVFPALEEFFTSLVKQEMVNMPRGVYHSALKGGVRSDQGKTVAGIPNFILKMYETNKQPGLKPGLAGGMLFCYDISTYQSKEGKPLNRLMASRGRSFKQTSLALVHEVHIQLSEWHRAIFLPQAWLAYMSRAYHAILQGRIGELDLQLKHGKEGPEEVQYKKGTAWLWVRDMLTDEITKTAVKESPVVKGNALLALSSLAVVVSRHEASLSSDSEGVPEVHPNFLSMKEWVSMVSDTLLVIVDSHHQPRGQIFSSFYYKSYSGENTASAIARSAAATALSLLVQVFIISCKEKVEEILNMLTARLPGKPRADESQAVQIHMGLALGMFLSRLCEEKLSDVSGQQMNLLLMKSLDALENCCFDASLEYNTGCILGVGLVLSLMSHSSRMESRVHVAASLRKLSTYLDDSGSQSRTFQEVLAYTLSCVCTSAFSAGIIEATEAEDIMNKLQLLVENNQQTSGFALALGNLVHGLSVCGHGKAEDLGHRLLPAWIRIVLTEGTPTMLCLAALHGMVALVGSEGDVMQLKAEAIQTSHFQARLNEVIKTVTQVISVSGVIGLQSNALWLLGHLHLSTLSSSQSRTSVPTDYSYLPESSFIRAAIGFFITGGKKGPESVPPSLLKVVMKPIAAVGESYQFPPVSWAALLSPLMRLNFGEEIQQLCLEIMVTQAQSSQNAAVLLGLWVMPPLIHSLSLNAKKYLLVSTPLWIKHVSDEQMAGFVENLMVAVFKTASPLPNPELCISALQGLSQAMKLPSPAHHLWSLLCEATGKIFDLLPKKIRRNDLELYISVAKCLSEMTDDEANRVAQITESSVEKAAFVRLYLVSQGRFPLTGLTDILSVAIQHREKDTLAWMVLHGLYQARIVSHANTGVLKRMEWLLELMGYIRNLAYQSTSVQNVALDEALDFLLLIFAIAVVAWADHAAPLLLGLSASWLPWHRENGPAGSASSFLGRSPMHRVTLQETLTLLPSSMPILLQKEPWKEQTQKFIDWLFSIMESPKEGLSAKSRDLLKGLRDLVQPMAAVDMASDMLHPAVLENSPRV
ncbi:focadhesin isoform X1 [Prionailurus viverrinus]|uniref:focadhesin isoform X1 n=1 Tax=Prionailurus viverrinus TaxID=61388 RepID=UPI001FF4D3EA|nr:focadhesin isoform X1 [Prionailurus viverrinus]XP_047684931.1 focadhesin isoform X1 [Prionailurus viverrinus]XP_047684932.1 focadhesin isoform X1 [Prionailurus viverrinus]XP_047684934.1 focadhesin isoform X1 [Prionailurus viverrinus]XP_047684935.1 focadhesin isoform X1 [Prionailurus viverrinus]XP_047684936.1 focadhesin isoform X1 [Prionailurus viverrinus]XP_047684937.1 focadhesin isoform X1 [Prionailurus viverrinus]